MEGYLKSEVCNRDGCLGIIDEYDKEGSCSCHINPPCSYCTTCNQFCEKCGWSAEEENLLYEKAQMEIYNNSKQKALYEKQAKERLESDNLFYKKYRGEIKADKLEIRYENHTHFSMIKKGVFPTGSETSESLLKHIRGTFGGRFTRLNEYSFSYVAYTD